MLKSTDSAEGAEDIKKTAIDVDESINAVILLNYNKEKYLIIKKE
jgi:hypothetical protein